VRSRQPNVQQNQVAFAAGLVVLVVVENVVVHAAGDDGRIGEGPHVPDEFVGELRLDFCFIDTRFDKFEHALKTRDCLDAGPVAVGQDVPIGQRIERDQGRNAEGHDREEPDEVAFGAHWSKLEINEGTEIRQRQDGSDANEAKRHGAGAARSPAQTLDLLHARRAFWRIERRTEIPGYLHAVGREPDNREQHDECDRRQWREAHQRGRAARIPWLAGLVLRPDSRMSALI